MISYVMIILGIVLLAFFLTGKGMQRLTDENTRIARLGVENIVQGNNELSSRVLTKAGERIVKMYGEIAAAKLKLLLINKNKPYDYNKLRNNKEIRKVATQTIYATIDNEQLPAGNIDLIDIHGTSVIHLNKSIEGQNYREWKKQYPKMWQLVKASFKKPTVSGYYTFINKNNQPVKKFMVLTRVSGTPFIVTAYVEIKYYFERFQKEVQKIGDKHKEIVDKEMAQASNETLYDFETKGVVGGIIVIIVSILLAIWQAEAIAKPVQSLCEKVKEMGKGNFAISTPDKGTSEIAELATTFNALGGELTEYMANLKKETTARQAIESEIAITRKIQETLLPHTFPPFPDKTEFDLHASLIPAKDVSGDFYDFFFVDDDTLVLIIADVSGKGLPASLFMAVTRTLLRNLCMNTDEYSPDIIFKKANDYLCQDNDACMFVTTFLGFYNMNSGKLTYANAGHNEMISFQDKTDLKYFGSFPDLPLGILPDYDFQQAEYQVQKQETLIFYTDGVTEAVNQHDEQYGIKSFTDIINQYDSTTQLKTIIDDVNKDLHAYQGDKQFDDITIMMIRRNS